MLRFLLPALPLILAIYALVDCVQTPTQEIRGLPKPAWMALIVLPVVGPILWLVFGRRDSVVRRLLFPAPTTPGSPAAPGPRRTLAPDDDPDFLRGLGAAPRGAPPGRRTTRDEDALLDEWERDLRRNGPDPRTADPRPAPPADHADHAERDDPDDEGPEGSTDGAPRV